MGIIRDTQTFLFLGLSLIAVFLTAWALIHALLTKAPAFVAAGKRSKTFWVAIVGAAAVLAFIGIPYPLGNGGGSLLFTIGAAIAGGVYLADVRPAVNNMRGRGGRGQRGRGGSGRPPFDDPPNWRSW